MDPLYIVAVQLKTFTPLGMATRNVSAEKSMVANSLMPATNMWCPHTRKPKIASAMELIAMAKLPKMARREKVAISSLSIAIPGTIMM